MKLDNWLANRALACPERPALIAGGESVTYAELEAEASWVARRLGAHGVRRGSRVVLRAVSGREQVVIIHALMKLGAVVLPLSGRLAEAERLQVMEDQAPIVDLDDGLGLTQAEADLPLLGEHDLDDPFCRLMTSGTTGRPKAVELTYGNHLWSAVGSAFNLGVEPTDRWLCCLPFSHVAGLSILLRSVIYGITAEVHERFSVEAVDDALDRGTTLLSLVPTMLVRLLDANVDLSRARSILVGGGPVPKPALEEALAKGAPVSQTYGLTEAASQVTTLAPADIVEHAGSAGRPLLTTHLRIEAGEILVQGPTVAPGCVDADGWLHTGDLGRIDEKGYLWVEDRIDDLIISGGENVAPAEVEGVLMGHSGVADVAVIGRDDPDWQQAVTAVVVPSGEMRPDSEELRRFCAESLAPYKVPKRFEFTSSLPRTASGKLRRRALRSDRASEPSDLG